MFVFYIVGLTGAFYFAIQNQTPELNLIVTGMITGAFHFYNYNPKENQWHRFIKGETIYLIIYSVWLLFFRKLEFMYYVPIILGNLGKLMLTIHSKADESKNIAEELILFQTKTEAFIMIALLLNLLPAKGEGIM